MPLSDDSGRHLKIRKHHPVCPLSGVICQLDEGIFLTCCASAYGCAVGGEIPPLGKIFLAKEDFFCRLFFQDKGQGDVNSLLYGETDAPIGKGRKAQVLYVSLKQ